MKVKVTVELTLPAGTNRNARRRQIKNDDALQNWMIFQTIARRNQPQGRPLRVNVCDVLGVETRDGAEDLDVVVEIELNVATTPINVPFREVKSFITNAYTAPDWGFFALAESLEDCDPQIASVVQMAAGRPGKN